MKKKRKNYQRFRNLTFEDFKKLALDKKLSPAEKIGFPEEYREGYETKILKSIVSAIPELEEGNKTVLDLGCGCGRLAFKIIRLAKKRKHRLLLVGSEEVLSQLPNKSYLKKFPGKFPHCPELVKRYTSKIDIIIVYSVLHHVFLDSNIFDFLDKAVELLSDGGKLFLGDIPNISKRKRFFSSPPGIKFHQNFVGKKEIPKVEFLKLEPNFIDDSVVFSILQRDRNFGYETYLLPQPKNLYFSGRREDILIVKL